MRDELRVRRRLRDAGVRRSAPKGANPGHQLRGWTLDPRSSGRSARRLV
jgi:hypothetical protein